MLPLAHYTPPEWSAGGAGAYASCYVLASTQRTESPGLLVRGGFWPTGSPRRRQSRPSPCPARAPCSRSPRRAVLSSWSVLARMGPL